MRLNFGRFIRSMLIIGIIAYFCVKLVMGFLMDEQLTQTVVYGQLNIEKKYDGIIFRNELIINTNVDGNIRYNVADGDKIKKGLKVAEVYKDGSGGAAVESDSEDTTSYVAVQSLTISEADLEAEIEKLVQAMMEARRNNDYLQVKNLKQDLDLKLDKKEMLDSMADQGQSGFQQSFVGGGVLGEGQSIAFYSPKSGIVTFSSDGMESVLTTENIFKLDYETLMKENIEVKSLSTDYVHSGSPVYKIVDNSVWMLVALIDKSEIALYDEGKYVRVDIDNQTVSGVVSKVFESGEHGALVMKMTEQIPGFYKERLVKAKIIRENYQGLKVPSTAVVNRDGVQGVYVLGVDNRAVFKPVQVIGYDASSAVVKNGYVEVNKDGAVERMRSIDVNDDVLIIGANYNEGDTVY